MQKIINTVHGRKVINLFSTKDDNIETVIEAELLNIFSPSDSMSLEILRVIDYLSKYSNYDMEVVLQTIPAKIFKGSTINNTTRWIIILN